MITKIIKLFTKKKETAEEIKQRIRQEIKEDHLLRLRVAQIRDGLLGYQREYWRNK